MSRRRTDLRGQAYRALDLVDMREMSKKSYRKASGGHKAIHSDNWREETRSVARGFTTYLRDVRGRKDLYHVTRSDYRSYIDHKAAQGVSKGHLTNIESALRTLESGMNKHNASRGYESRDWTPHERIVHNYDKEKPVDRSYTAQGVDHFKEHLPSKEKYHNAHTLANAFGLREREISKSTPAYIEEKNGKYYWHASSDKGSDNKASGVTKAGRGRVAECRPEYHDKVKSMIAGKARNEHLSPKYNTLKDAFAKAGKASLGKSYSGTHGFRHSYARAQLERKLEECNMTAEGKYVIGKMFENRAIGVRRDQGIEREIYDRVWEVINEVHESLGHGHGRIDLVEVYMK